MQVDVALGFEDISPIQASELLENPNVVLLDVCTEEEYFEIHIENAVNIPLDTLNERLEELNLSKPIIVYSNSGVRSKTATYILEESGFQTVYNLVGGIIAWIEAGLDVISDDSVPFLPESLPGQLPSWVPFTLGATPDQFPLIQAKTEDTSGICIDSSFPGMYRSTVTLEEREFDMVEIPYIGYTTKIGEPMVPMVTRFVEIPPDVNAHVEIKFVESKILEDFLIMPFQEPRIDLLNASIPEFTINEAMYSRDNFYPFINTSIEGENAKQPIIVRGRRLMRLTYFRFSSILFKNKLKCARESKCA